MSIWTSDIGRAALICAALILTGCGGLGPITDDGATSGQTRIAVTDDRVVVAGPSGFCVDPQATQDRGTTAFVMLGNCAAITNSRRAGQPDVAALLTASISEPSDDGSLRESIPGLNDFFRSESGLQMLSRSQDASTVSVLDSFHQGDVYFLHARDTSQGVVEGVRDDYWRAYLDVGQRIATLSVLGLSDQTVTDEESLATLREFATSFAAANAGTPPAFEQPVQPTDTFARDYEEPAPRRPAASPSGTLWNVGLFRRIFN